MHVQAKQYQTCYNRYQYYHFIITLQVFIIVFRNHPREVHSFMGTWYVGTNSTTSLQPTVYYSSGNNKSNFIEKASQVMQPKMPTLLQQNLHLFPIVIKTLTKVKRRTTLRILVYTEHLNMQVQQNCPSCAQKDLQVYPILMVSV